MCSHFVSCDQLGNSKRPIISSSSDAGSAHKLNVFEWKLIHNFFLLIFIFTSTECSFCLIIDLSSRRRHIVDRFDLIGFRKKVMAVVVCDACICPRVRCDNCEASKSKPMRLNFIFGCAHKCATHGACTKNIFIVWVACVRVTRDRLTSVHFSSVNNR